MTNKSRTELVQLLGELAEEASELRFGQLIANLATLARGAQEGAIWDLEDDELEAAATRLLNRYRERRGAVIEQH